MKTPLPKVQRKATKFPVEKLLGVNLFAPHSALKEGELRSCTNLDLFKDGYMRGRLGSAVLNAIGQTLDNYDILNGLAWDTGADEYAVLQGVQGTSTYFITLKLERDAAFAVVNDYAGSAYSVAGQTEPMAMQLSGGRVFAFGREGNAVIDWTGSAFRARPMGLQAPVIDSATFFVNSPSVGGVAGRWTIGLELVYRINGADFLSSGIRRYMNDGQIATFTAEAVSNIAFELVHDSLDYPAGIPINSFDDGMCLRVWRSKNQAPVSTDPTEMPDTFGLSDELYPIFMNTVYQVLNGTGSPGNYGFGTAYEADVSGFEDYHIDIQFAPDEGNANYPIRPRIDMRVATLDYMDLTPIPASPCGCQHKGRIWFASDAGKLQYSKITDTPYSEVYSPQDFVLCDPGDGQSIVWMTGMDKDLIIFKEGKTGRVMDGDPAMGFNLLDKVVGLSHIKLAAYLPSLGIVAITGDQKDVRLFGYDLLWKNISGEDIAKRIRSVTKSIAQAPTYAAFAWINGKLAVSPGDGTLWMLHAEEGLGWTRYTYPMGGESQFLLSFSNGSRLAVFGRGRFAIEIETDKDAYGEPIDTDVNLLGEEVEIEREWTTHRFQSGKGRDMLDFDKFSVVGELSYPIYAMAYSNGRPWPSNLDSDETLFTPDPAQMTGYSELMEREYTLRIKPPAPCGSFLHFAFRTTGPCSIRSQELSAYVQTEVRQDFDPFQIFRRKKVGPPWSNQALCVLTFDDDLDGQAIDYSGWARHHTYDPGEGGSMSHLPGFSPGNGARFLAGSGAGLFPAYWQGMEGMGDDEDGLNSRARSWKLVLRQTEAADAVLAYGGDPLEDANYWRLRLTSAGTLIFESGIEAAAYTFTSPTGILVPDTEYALCFTLTNGGENGQFYLNRLSASSFGGPIRTTRTVLTRQAPPDRHGVAVDSAIDLSWYETLLGDMSEKDAKRFWQEMKEAD